MLNEHKIIHDIDFVVTVHQFRFPIFFSEREREREGERERELLPTLVWASIRDRGGLVMTDVRNSGVKT